MMNADYIVFMEGDGNEDTLNVAPAIESNVVAFTLRRMHAFALPLVMSRCSSLTRNVTTSGLEERSSV